MVYNGLGQRLEMTAFADGQSLTTQYLLDSQSSAAPLAATANGESTFYLYGLGAAAERAAGWNYYLRDGLGSLRQMVDGNAEITLERSYTPWGDVLSQSGTLDPTQVARRNLPAHFPLPKPPLLWYICSGIERCPCPGAPLPLGFLSFVF